MGGNFAKPPIVVLPPKENETHFSFPPVPGYHNYNHNINSGFLSNNLNVTSLQNLNNGSMPHPFSSFAPYSPGIRHKPFYPHGNYPFGNHYNFPSAGWSSLLPSSNSFFANPFNPFVVNNPLLNNPVLGNNIPSSNQVTTPSTPTAVSTDKPIPIHMNDQLATLLVDPSLRPLPAAPIYLGTYRWFDYGKTHKIKPYQKPTAVLTSLSNPLGRPVNRPHQATPLMHSSVHHHRPSFNNVRSNSQPPPGMHSSRLIPRISESIHNPVHDVVEVSQETPELQFTVTTSTTTQSNLKQEDNLNSMRSPQDQELYEHFQQICIELKGYRCDSGPSGEKYSHENQKRNVESRDVEGKENDRDPRDSVDTESHNDSDAE
jgi:hypothetical protein